MSNNPVTVSHFKLSSLHSISSVVVVSLPLKDVSTYQHKRFLAACSFHCFHFNFFTRRAWCGGGTWNERSCFIALIVIVIIIIVPPFQVIGVIFKIRPLPLQYILQLHFSLKKYSPVCFIRRRNVRAKESSPNSQRKTLRVMKTEREVKRITFDRPEAKSGRRCMFSCPS